MDAMRQSPIGTFGQGLMMVKYQVRPLGRARFGFPKEIAPASAIGFECGRGVAKLGLLERS
jgi:hypothetical protein